MSLWPSKSVALKKRGPQKAWPSKSLVPNHVYYATSLRSRTMPADCFNQATINFFFYHLPFLEGMILRSLQYEFCYSTPTL